MDGASRWLEALATPLAHRPAIRERAETADVRMFMIPRISSENKRASALDRVDGAPVVRSRSPDEAVRAAAALQPTRRKLLDGKVGFHDADGLARHVDEIN